MIQLWVKAFNYMDGHVKLWREFEPAILEGICFFSAPHGSKRPSHVGKHPGLQAGA